MKNQQVVNPKQEFIKYLVDGAVKMLESHTKDKSVENMTSLMSDFLVQFTTVMLDKSLQEQKGQKSNEKQYEYVAGNYSVAKVLVQIAIGEAFTKSLSKFSGKRVEYYCQVHTAPKKAANKMPC